jgi:hypothetical protein
MIFHRPKILWAGLVLFALASPAPSSKALDWNAYHENTNSRFYTGADGRFLGGSLNWSGVGVIQSDFGWATMISDRYFLSSYHIQPNVTSSDVHFYRTNSLSTSADNYAQASIDTSFGQRLTGTDLWLGRLTAAAPSWVKRYPLIKRQDSMIYGANFDPTMYTVGYKNLPGSLDYRKSQLGTNQIASVGAGLLSTKDAGAGDAEAITIGGDSGGPTFVPSTFGGLALAGIHWSADDFIAVDTNVSKYISQITAGVPERVNVVTDLAGDLNGDFRVDFHDFSALYTNYNRGPITSYNDGDIDGDGLATFSDFITLWRNYGKSLFAAADFNQDQKVDKLDMLQIGNHWHTMVPRYTSGDASGNGYVDGRDLDLLNASWQFGTWTTSNPIPPVPGDINGEGLIDDKDYTILSAHFGRLCSSQQQWCGGADINKDGVVSFEDSRIMSVHWDPFGPADINQDGLVNNTDLAVVLTHWMQTATGKSNGDLNVDGAVDYSDFVIMTSWWGRGVASLSTQPVLGLVPEPSSAAVGTFGLLILCGAHRRSR